MTSINGQVSHMTRGPGPNVSDYDKMYKDFRWEVPAEFNFAWDVIDKWAQADPYKVALYSVYPDGKTATTYTYEELSIMSKRFANASMRMGLKKGDRVLVMLPRIPAFYITMIGLIRMGAIPMPTPTLSMAKDIHYRLTQSEGTTMVTTNEFAPRLEEVEKELPKLKIKLLMEGTREGWQPMHILIGKEKGELKRSDVVPTRSDDEMLIFFTSGTEGYPKMVLHTHSYPLGHYATSFMIQDVHPTDTMWAIADTGWAKASWGKLFGQFLLGACVLQHNQKGKFDAAQVLEIIERFKVSIFCAPPTVYRMLILEPSLKTTDYSKLRHSLSAGEPLNPEVIKEWKDATGLDIYDFYGQTETVALVGNCRAFPIRQGSMGRPTLGHDVRLIDDDGKEVETGQEGNIALKLTPIRPPGLMKEYWKRPEANQKSFLGEWYLTGDKAYKDPDGYFWFVGRADDVIKSSGYRISPFEVESVLVEHDAVAEAAVIGVPDDLRGVVLKAFIILAPGFKPSYELAKEIQDHVKRTTAPYKYPRVIEFVETLPKTISGKIQRKLLRKMEAEKLTAQVKS
jgi:acetyl-CoA synthetase